MPEVTLTINNTPYRLACSPGEEEQLQALGAILDEKVSGIVAEFGQVGDARILLLAALMLLDEARTENESLFDKAAERATSIASLQAAAEKIDHIAERLETA